MERTIWTDERMTDAIARIDQRFDQLDRNLDQRFNQVDQRFNQVDRSFDRVWDELRETRGQMAASNRQLAQIGWALVGILFVQLIAAIVAFS